MIKSVKDLLKLNKKEETNNKDLYSILVGKNINYSFLPENKSAVITNIVVKTIKKVSNLYKLNLPCEYSTETHNIYISNTYTGETDRVWDIRVKNLFMGEELSSYKLINSKLNKKPTWENPSGKLLVKRLSDNIQKIDLYFIIEWNVEFEGS